MQNSSSLTSVFNARSRFLHQAKLFLPSLLKRKLLLVHFNLRKYAKLFQMYRYSISLLSAKTFVNDCLEQGFLICCPWMWCKGLVGFADISITTSMIKT